MTTPHIAFIAAGSLAVYLNVLTNGFVIDDLPQVVNNPWLRDVRHLPEIFSTGVWSFEGRDSNYYRPMMHFIYMIVYHIVGLKPWGYHLVNVLFHSATSVLVFLTISLIFRKASPSSAKYSFHAPLVAAAMFATHPIHTEAVAWVAGILDLSYSFFFLLSLYFYIRSGSRFDAAYVVSVLSFMLSVFCKEPALTLPFVLIAYDFSVSKDSEKPIADLKRYIPYLVVAGIYMGMRYYALGGIAPVKTSVSMDAYAYVINVLLLISQYMGKLLIPVDLNFWHVFRPLTSALSFRGIIAVLVAAGLILWALISARRDRGMFLGLVVLVLPLAPTLYIPALAQGSENAFAERYLYLPSFGFVFLAAYFVEWVAVNRPRWARPVLFTFLVTVIIYSFGTVSRNFVWKDSYTLWSDAARKSPGSSIVHENLAYSLMYQGRVEEGKRELQVALNLDPRLFRARMAKGMLYGSKGFIDKAIFEFNRAVMFKPDSVEAHYNLATAYDAKGWMNEAMEQYEIALKLDPGFADAHNNLGIAYAKNNLLEKAIFHFEEAVRQNPSNASIRRNLAKAYGLTGASAKAEEQMRAVRKLENGLK